MVPVLLKDEVVSWNLSIAQFYLPDDAVLPEPAHQTTTLSEKDAGTVYDSSEYQEQISVEYIEDRIRKGINEGIYENNKLVAWGLTHDDVTGIDFYDRSINYAKETAARKALDIDYVCRNYLEFETEKRVDLITMIMCDFCALSQVQRKQMLNKYRVLLSAEGSVLLDVYSLSGFEQAEEVSTHDDRQLEGFWSKEDYYSFLNTFKYDDEKAILEKYTIVEKAHTRTVCN